MGTESERLLRGAEAISRRDILQVGTVSAGLAGASALALGPPTASAQQLAQNTAPAAGAAAPADNRPVRTGERQPFYDYSPISKRPKLKWPNGARVAVMIMPNVGHWDMHDDKGHMDVRKMPRNDYGLRVAVWRLMEMFGERRIQTIDRAERVRLPLLS